MKAKDRIIVALDTSDVAELDRMTSSLAGEVGMFKIGLEAMTAIGGPQAVDVVRRHGIGVFYDGKFDDIPNTVGKASAAAVRAGVKMFNVHASAGPEAVEAAVAQRETAKVLAVTVLTSMDEEVCRDMFGAPPDEAAAKLAKRALAAGADGIICSPQEVDFLKGFGWVSPDLLFVTPGVRPKWASSDDQRRVMTPDDAIRAGATHLVIGRPIAQAGKYGMKPHEAARRIAEEIEEALS